MCVYCLYAADADDAAHDNTQELHLFVAEMVRAEVSTPKPCEEKHTEGVPESETIDSSTGNCVQISC